MTKDQANELITAYGRELVARNHAAVYAAYEALLNALIAETSDKQEAVAYVNGDELDNMFDDRVATIQGKPDGWRKTPLYAAPAPSPQTAIENERDAKRYRWLVKNCFDWAAPGDGDSFDHIELHFESDMLSRDDESVGQAIDAEIAEENGQ